MRRQNESGDAAANASCFSELPLSPEVISAVGMAGYERPTPVQSQIIPLIDAGRDVLAQSQTGTGKTAAFALPLLSKIDVCRREPQVLVLAPTRELAIQVTKSFSTYANQLPGFAAAAIYGGQDYSIQFRQLKRGVQVVVGTPGRVIDHVKRGTLDLSRIDCLVLDEADEMLNMGFLEDVEFVLQQTPESRQTALFSATLPNEVRRIARRHLNDPIRVAIENTALTSGLIRQRAVLMAPHQKLDALVRFLEVESTDGVLVFARTREATVDIAKELELRGFSAIAMNGDMPQRARERTIERLRSGQIDIVVATDVAARGLDVPRVSHVFNFDAPHDSQSYIHRIGRTGRAGSEGEAIIFLTQRQRTKMRSLQRATNQPIEQVEVPSAREINQLRARRFKERITEAASREGLDPFHSLIFEHVQESGMPLETVAAALAHLAQGDRPLFLRDERNEEKRRPTRLDRGHPERGPRPKHDRRDPPRPRSRVPQMDGRAPASRGSRGRRDAAPAMETYRVDVGREHGVKPSNIVGAIANEGGIDGASIGSIEIHDFHSTIELPKNTPPETVALLDKTRAAGRLLRLRREGDAEESPRPRSMQFEKAKVRSAKPARKAKGDKRKKTPRFAKKKKNKNRKAR